MGTVGSGIPEPPEEPAQLAGRRITLLLNAGQRRPVLIPPALERRDELLPMVGDVAREDGIQVGAEDTEGQVFRALLVERSACLLEPLGEVPSLVLSFFFTALSCFLSAFNCASETQASESCSSSSASSSRSPSRS